MNYKNNLEQRMKRLIGRRITRVRYDQVGCDGWMEFGPDIDVDIDSLLIDLDGGEPANLTWSSESGFSYGLTIAFEPHGVDTQAHARGDGWFTVDVSATSRWSEVIGQSVVEARLDWETVFTEEVPESAVKRQGGTISIDSSKTVPSAIHLVPQTLALRFDGGRWVVISAARYRGAGEGFYGWMDDIVVVHDDAFMRMHQMGPYAAPV